MTITPPPEFMRFIFLTIFFVCLGLSAGAQSLLLTAPNGGEIWRGGTQQTIKWDYTNVDNIRIEYSLNNGLTWNLISASYPTSALSYSWRIPCIGSNQVKVRITNTLQYTQDESNGTFTIPEPIVDLTYPNGGERFGAGTGQYIEWNATDVVTVAVQYTIDDGKSWQDIGEFPAINKYCNWDAPLQVTNQARIRIWNIESARNRDSSQASFQVVRTTAIDNNKYKGGPLDGYNMCSNLADALEVKVPNGGGTYQPKDTLKLQWTYRHVDQLKIEYTINDGGTWSPIVSDIPASRLTYDWVIPNTPSTQCRIRITDMRTGLSDVSDALFTIKPAFINLTYPNGGERFGQGTGQYITWTSGSVTRVKVEYSADQGASWKMVGTFPASDQYANWDIPSVTGDAFLIRVSDEDLPAVTDRSDQAFSIFRLPALDPKKYLGGMYDGYSMNSSLRDSLRVISPNGAEQWTAASTRTIRWTYNEVDNISLEYTLDDGITWKTIVTNIPASRLSYDWEVPVTPSYLCRVRIKDIGRDIQDQSDSVFIIPNSYVTITYPNGGERFGAGTGQYIEWDYRDLATVKLEYSADSGSTWQVIGTAPAEHRYANWVVPEMPSGKLLIRATDVSNPLFTDRSNTTFVSQALPALNPNKYKGGEFDGYSMYSYKDVYVKVISPNGGEIWGNGTTQRIRWATLNTTENLKVDYSIDNEATWTTLLNNVPNTPGFYDWRISSPVSNTCIVRATTMSGVEYDKSDNFFTIANTTGIVTNPVIGTSFCAGSKTTVTYQLNTTFKPGNKFIVQLSDSVGTFSGSLVNIGEVASVTPQSINVTFPVLYDQASKYRMRVIATDPPTIGTDNGVDLTILPLPKVALGNDTVICPGTSIMLKAGTAENTYRWSTGEFTSSITITKGGIYWVDATNACGTTRDTIRVVQDSLPVVSLGPDTLVCKNTAITLDAGIQQGTYLWSTGAVSQKINVVVPGTYAVSVRNQCGVVSDEIVVGNLPAVVVDLGADRGLCEGERLTLDAGNSVGRFVWSTGDTTRKIEVTKPGTYSVNLTGQCGTISDQITIYDGVFRVNAGEDANVCEGGTTVLTASGGNSYLWNTGATTASISVSPTATTTYTVQAKNIYGCSATDQVKVTVLTEPLVPVFSPIGPVCRGSSYTMPLISKNGIRGTWYPAFNGSATTTYTFTPTAGQCATTVSMKIEVTDQTVVPTFTQVASICRGGGFTLPTTSLNGIQGTWSPAVNNQATTTYTFNPASGFCASAVTMTVIVTTPIPPMFSLDTVRICGETYRLDAGNDGAVYSWSTGAQTRTLDVSRTGWYRCTVERGGCKVTDSIFVSIVDGRITQQDTIICSGQSLKLDANAAMGVVSGGDYPLSYRWSTGAQTSSISVQATQNSIYRLTVTDGVSTCSDSVRVAVDSSRLVSLLPDSIYSRADSIKLDAGPGFARYAWTGGGNTQAIHVSYTGKYVVTLTNALGCSAKDSVFVQFPDTVGLHISTVDGLCNQSLDLPIRVSNFRKILTMQGSVQWNVADLRFDSISNYGPAILGMNAGNFGSSQTANGRLTFSWNDANVIGRSLADSVILFTLRFTPLGSTIRSAVVSFAESPTKIDIQDASFTSKKVDVKSGGINITCELSIEGKVLTPLDQAIPNVSVVKTGGVGTTSIRTDSSGSYRFKVLPGSYTLTPVKTFEQFKMNGISTLDIVLIQSHILQRVPLNSAYKVIAADADHSGSVTSSDILLIRRLILGSDSSFPGNRNWVFVDGDQTFADPKSPFPYRNTRSFNNLSANVSDTFRGIKVGDVNYDRNPLLDQAPSGDTLRLYVEWRDTDDGFIILRVKSRAVSSLLGWQSTLRWDPTQLELQTVTRLVNNLGIGEHWKGGGYITLSWNDPRAEGLNFTEGLDWFELKFKKTERFKKTSLSISEEKLGTEAFNGKFQSMGVKMEQIDLLNHSGKMMRVYPNPASGYMHIEWKMKHAGHAIIRILDAQGRIVYVQRGEYKSGIQRELIRRSAGWSVAGTCVVEVQTNEDVSSLPVIFIDE